MAAKAIISVIVLAGVALGVVLGFVNGNYAHDSFGGYQKDSEIYILTAEYLLDRGVPHGEDSLIVGGFRRPPGYPLFLAGLFSAFGRNPIVIWIAQAFLFALTIVLLWKISGLFLPERWALLPPALLSLSWFVASAMSGVVSEIWAVFLAAFFVYLALSPERARLGASGLVFGLLVLVKPIALYLAPIIAFYFIMRDRRWIPALLFLAALGITLAPWLVYTKRTFDSYQIAGTGAQVFAWKAREATAPWSRIGASLVGGAVGDLPADIIFPGYAENTEPLRHVQTVFNASRAMRSQGVPEVEIERHFMQEAIYTSLANPLKFAVTSVTGLLRLNTPMNHLGWHMTHFLAETHNGIPLFIKLLVNFFVRAGWYVFLGAVAITLWRRRRAWPLVLIVVVYWNAMHALFTHNEARFILPVMPLYLLALGAFIYNTFYVRRA